MTTNGTKSDKEMTNCCCGCGMATKGGKFIPGHDAKLKSLLNAVLAGEAPATTIPEIARERKAEIGFLAGKGNRLSRAFGKR